MWSTVSTGLMFAAVASTPTAPATLTPFKETSVQGQTDPAVREVLAADDERRAATARNDVAALQMILTDDFTYTHSTGFREGKNGYLDRIRKNEVRYIGLDRLAANVRIYGNVAIVDGTASMRYQRTSDTTPQQLDSLYLGVWVKLGTSWRMTSYASTLIQK